MMTHDAIEYYWRKQIVIPPLVLPEHMWKTKDHKLKKQEQIKKEKELYDRNRNETGTD